MTWQSVGTHTFLPTDRDVQVGSFDLAPGQDTVWVRITQLNQPAEWPWSYGILSWRSSSGLELGSTKAYSTQLGEVFRLGVGLPPSDRTGSIWFEPRGFNLGWIKAGFPWQLSFEAQAGAGEVNFNPYWGRVDSTLSPATAGDSVFTSGDVKVGGTIAAPIITLDANGSANFQGPGTAACGISPNGPFGGRFNAFGSSAATGNGSYEPDRINFTSTVGFFVLNNNATGVRLNPGATAWTAQGSSAALKDEAPYPQAVTNSFDLVKNIKLHRYYYKTQDQNWRDSHPVPYWGPYAEELQALDPDLYIPANKDAGTDPTYNAALLDMHTLAALQEALIRIEALESRLT